MYDYQTRGCGPRGADMGRRSDLPTDTTDALRLRHVPLDDGYDPGGAYWGTPDDLYCVWNADGQVRYLRAAGVEAVRARFPGASWMAEEGPTEADLADMVDAYVGCALWLATGDDGEPLDKQYNVSDFTPESRAEMQKICEAFAREHAAILVLCIGHQGTHGHRACDWSLAGHDLCLSQSETGAGFGDGDWPDPADDLLHDAARKIHRIDVCVDDDGKLYVPLSL